MQKVVRALGGRTPFTVLVVAVALILSGVIFVEYHQQSRRLHESSYLSALWQNYKLQHYSAGRAVDQQNDSVTTSEGQSYTMMRAVWQNDPATFAETWNWTSTQLERNDHLFSWRWGKRSDGTMGILTDQGGENSASDADTLIAYALLMADAKWHNASYASAAHEIIPAIWNEEVISVRGVPYLAADNLEKSATKSIFMANPSYAAPYAYRAFAQIDPNDNWQSLVSSSYTFLQSVMNEPLDAGKSAELPPDWVVVSRQTGQVQAPTNPHQTTDFGFNAFRTVWQLSVDYQWYHDTRSKQLLQQLTFLNEQWEQHHELRAIYSHSGQPKVDYASLALYGGTIGYFKLFHDNAARSIVSNKLESQYSARDKQFISSPSYYDNNWMWFGYALYSGQLPNVIEARR
jgi:endoglucanase